jgi:hypothetical protein
MVRVEGGTTFIDHTIVLGRRQFIADVEHVLTGMKVGCYRKVRVSPHLERAFYLNSPNAVLILRSGYATVLARHRLNHYQESHEPSRPGTLPEQSQLRLDAGPG